MTTNTLTRKPRQSREERSAKLAALSDRYAAYAESLNEAELAVHAARFDHYSLRNACLIVMQDPDATVVHGYGAWKALGRQVRKGSVGIAILAPAGSSSRKTDDGAEPGESFETKERHYFKLTYVFDLRQTESIAEIEANRVPTGLDQVDLGDLWFGVRAE